MKFWKVLQYRGTLKTWMGWHALLQGIFPTQGSNLGLLHCRLILYWLSHQEAPQSYILQHAAVENMPQATRTGLLSLNEDLCFCTVSKFRRALEKNVLCHECSLLPLTHSTGFAFLSYACNIDFPWLNWGLLEGTDKGTFSWFSFSHEFSVVLLDFRHAVVVGIACF